MKSGNLNILESSGPLQACNGTALPLPLLLKFQSSYLKKLKCEISRKSIQWEPKCSMRTVKQTYKTELIAVYSKYGNAPEKEWSLYTVT